jgi:ABC-2 type transport system permease protein
MKFFKEIKDVFIREFLKIMKDRNLYMILLLAPISYPILYGAIYIDKIETKVPIAVRDDDNSSLSRTLTRNIDAHQNIKIVETVYDDSRINEGLANEDFQGMLYIPKGFAKNLKQGKKTNINLIMSPARLLVLSDIGFPVSQIALYFGATVSGSAMMNQGMPVLQNLRYVQPINIDFQYLLNPYLSYGDMILPGLMTIIISQIVLIGSAASSAKEWSLNKWHDLFDVSYNSFSIIVGKLSLYTFMFMMYGFYIVGVLSPFYEIHFFSLTSSFLITAILGIAASATFGTFIGTYFKHRITVFVVLGFSSYPFFMLSGYAWPSQQFMPIVKYLSNIFPLTPFMQTMYSTSQLGNSLSYCTDFIILMIGQITVYSIFFYLRLLRFKRNKERTSKLGKYIAELPR